MHKEKLKLKKKYTNKLRQLFCKYSCNTLIYASIFFVFASKVYAEEEKKYVLKSAMPSVQWSLTVENGGGILGRENLEISEGVYHFGGHANIFIKRKGPTALGAGLSATAGSFDMKSFFAGGGVSILVPVSSFLPLIFEIIPEYFREQKKDNFAIGGRLWWGIHSFNYHSNEVASAGIYMIFQKGLTGKGSRDLWVAVWGIDISLHIFAIPFGVAWQAIFKRN